MASMFGPCNCCRCLAAIDQGGAQLITVLITTPCLWLLCCPIDGHAWLLLFDDGASDWACSRVEPLPDHFASMYYMALMMRSFFTGWIVGF